MLPHRLVMACASLWTKLVALKRFFCVLILCFPCLLRCFILVVHSTLRLPCRGLHDFLHYGPEGALPDRFAWGWFCSLMLFQCVCMCFASIFLEVLVFWLKEKSEVRSNWKLSVCFLKSFCSFECCVFVSFNSRFQGLLTVALIVVGIFYLSAMCGPIDDRRLDQSTNPPNLITTPGRYSTELLAIQVRFGAFVRTIFWLLNFVT